MNFNPSQESEVQGLHTALGAIFILLPVAMSVKHPILGLGHPQIVGTYIGICFALVKEFIWDQWMEDIVTRGSNLKDFLFYILGILIANFVLWI